MELVSENKVQLLTLELSTLSHGQPCAQAFVVITHQLDAMLCSRTSMSFAVFWWMESSLQAQLGGAWLRHEVCGLSTPRK